VSHPLFEYDASPSAMFNPSRHRGRAELAEHGVVCFFDEVVREVTASLEPAYGMKWEHGVHPVWVVERDGRRLTVCNVGCGAPLAGANLDVLIAMGCTKIVACGGAGVLVPGFDVGHVVVPTAALRDEGTSYHYLPVSHGRTVAPTPDALAAIVGVLDAGGVPHEQGLTWTTDGVYRETPQKVAQRRAEGCLTVEMEAAALFAVAAFRGATVGQLLYCGDDLSADDWDHRGWDRHESARRHLFELAAEAALAL
jgi:uridine phosphorylase